MRRRVNVNTENARGGIRQREAGDMDGSHPWKRLWWEGESRPWFSWRLFQHRRQDILRRCPAFRLHVLENGGNKLVHHVRLHAELGEALSHGCEPTDVGSSTSQH